MKAKEIAETYAGVEWAEMTRTRQEEVTKEVADSLAKGVPASWFAEQALNLYRAQAAQPTEAPPPAPPVVELSEEKKPLRKSLLSRK